MRHRIRIVPLAVLGLAASCQISSCGTAGLDSSARVRVERGAVRRKATAVGRIEAEYEIAINSPSSGVVNKLFVTLGQKVDRGDPLAEVRPIVTDRTLVEAERGLRLARDAEDTAREYLEGRHIAAYLMRAVVGTGQIKRMARGAELGRRRAEENLQLLEEGEVEIAGRTMDYVVRAPVGGHVVELMLREGAPVVPSSSYGTGSVLMTLADMDRLVFRGTVDEIDVGRLEEGMPARIRIGALPGAEMKGTLAEIALKAREQNNAMTFAVRIDVQKPEGIVLRSGFSAVAEIDVDRRDGVLVLPERVVEFRGAEAFVQVPDGRGGRREVEIETGLSDELTVEITGGLAEGDEVLERVYE